MLAVIRVLGDDDVVGAFICKDLRCSLEEQTVTAGMETDDDTHDFPVAREGDHLNDLDRLANFLPILPTKVLGKLKKGGLGLGSYESELFGLGVDVFEGSRVDRDGSAERALRPGGRIVSTSSCSIEKSLVCLDLLGARRRR